MDVQFGKNEIISLNQSIDIDECKDETLGRAGCIFMYLCVSTRRESWEIRMLENRRTMTCETIREVSILTLSKYCLTLIPGAFKAWNLVTSWSVCKRAFDSTNRSSTAAKTVTTAFPSDDSCAALSIVLEL